MEHRYHFALSFAGEDRHHALELALLLKEAGTEVFYDEWGRANIWGKTLEIHLDEIYRFRARYCILFVSRHYTKSGWTAHEFASALSAARTRRVEYILPLRLDDTDLVSLPSGIAHLDARVLSMSRIAQCALEKLQEGCGPDRPSINVDRSLEAVSGAPEIDPRSLPQEGAGFCENLLW